MSHAADEELANAIETIDNLAHALELAVPDAIHVQALRESLPRAVQRLKTAYETVTGHNPWAD